MTLAVENLCAAYGEIEVLHGVSLAQATFDRLKSRLERRQHGVDQSGVRRHSRRDGGCALGDERFKRQIAKALGRQVAPFARGGPTQACRERRKLNLL